MPRVEFSPKSEELLAELIRYHGADDYFLDRLGERLQEIAERPAHFTEPSKFPYPPNRLMANFLLNDATAKVWGVTVTLRRLPDEYGIYILTINAAPFPIA